MFDQGTQFKYFKNILREIYTIIDINWNIKDSDTLRLIGIISNHLAQYNNKSGFVRMGYDFNEETKTLIVYLSDYVRGRGVKKKFQDVIPIQYIIHDRILEDILNELDDDDDEEEYTNF